METKFVVPILVTRLVSAGVAGFLLAAQARGLEVSGIVQDKFENPLAGARICLQGTQRCVASGADGKFRYAEDAVSLRPVDPALLRASLRLQGTALVYEAPVAGRAIFAWTDARGTALAPARTADLRAGANRLDLPASPLAPGLAFLRVTGPGYALGFKVVSGAAPGDPAASGRREPAGGGRSARVAAAAKSAAAAASLDIVLAGYRPKVHAAAQDVETGVVVELRPLGDRILFGGTSLDAWGDYSNGAWKVADGVLYHRGGSGALYTKENFGDFRLVTTSRKPGGGHNPNFLLWCKAGSTDKRTLGGIQFQPPLGHMWDYIANESPTKLGTQTRLGSTAGLKVEQWARCESLAKVSTATIRFACCNLEGTKKTCSATEIVKFTDPKFARSGPVALMIHDTGQQQDYKDIEIEVNPLEPDRLLSVKPR